MAKPAQEQIEIIPTSLLDEQRLLVNSLKALAKSLNLEFGWHYLLDLSWVISRLGDLKGKRIMDAGAGTGVMQWYLAQQGATVISVDRGSRAALPVRFRTRFRVQGLRKSDLLPTRQVFRNHFSGQGKLSVKLSNQAHDLLGMTEIRRSSGRVIVYNQDLSNLVDIPSNSLDAIVAISALEHNPQENLTLVVNELMRTLKPGGLLLASLNAARDADWWHEASSGWCYTDSSLRRLFCLPPEASSNYARYDELFAALSACAELRDGLAKFYFRSANNGMPWGKWEPQYQPVGVCKIKK
jgi:2-polyprenyl-3-methyl-5-hydroxy-6-metoxy-1,4-benzoquinol methylase